MSMCLNLASLEMTKWSCVKKIALKDLNVM